LDLQFILKSSALLNELNRTDLVIDFSGDRFGDNPFVSIFLEDWAEILMAKKLGKPVVMFAGSPGPFDKFFRKLLAKYALNRVDLITNREPVSTELLKDMGVRPEIIKSMACPAFLFEPRRRDDIADVLEEEGIISENKKPLVGIILCGWSMPKPPYYKVPREKEELIPFAELVKHLIENLGVRVMLMSHQNNTDKQMNLIPANDYVIVHQLYDILKQENYGDDLFVLDGLYDAPTSKAIIGCFDMLISGRIHGAVGGLSQEIPTVIINYGNGPRPHKLKGFAKLTGMEEYVCDPADAQDMIEKAGYVWKNREAVRGHLKKRIPQVKELAKANFKLLREFV
jgi:colanic acid/amylovoran biosynthesis protein